MHSDSRDAMIEGTIALRELLRQIVQRPNDFKSEEDLVQALGSQARTAKLDYKFIDSEDLTRATLPMSLNSLKNYANQLCDQGFPEINNLRVAALSAVIVAKERNTKPNKRTKKGLLRLVNDHESAVQRHQKINYILLQAISTASRAIDSVKNAPDNKVKQKRAEDAQEKLRAILTLNPPPFDRLKTTLSVVDKDSPK